MTIEKRTTRTSTSRTAPAKASTAKARATTKAVSVKSVTAKATSKTTAKAGAATKSSSSPVATKASAKPVAKATAPKVSTKPVAKASVANASAAPVVKAAAKAAAAKSATKPAAKAKSAAHAERLLEFYREMLFIRRFEERAARGYTQALIGGYCHLNLGEEAAVVGLMSALRSSDYLFTNYREHGYAIARGIDPRKIMAELYGRVDGVSKGWGGSMHMFDLTHRLLGGYGIVGGQIPLATGAALAIDYRGGDDVVMCTMGDGTTNIGAFHESLNIASLWNLPIVFVIINNRLGMGTTVEKSSAEPELYRRGAAYRIESARVNGLDPGTVAEAAQHAVDVARTGRPYLLEVVCERLRGHSVVDPAKYRSAEEVEDLKLHDPVHTLASRLVAEKITDAATLELFDVEVLANVDEINTFAENSAFPDVETLFDYNYATPVANDSRRLPGQPLFNNSPESGADQ